MKTIVLDKIASVTKSVALKREVRLSATIPCEEGIVIAVRVLTDKSVYNQIELPSWRMAQVKRGGIVAGLSLPSVRLQPATTIASTPRRGAGRTGGA